MSSSILLLSIVTIIYFTSIQGWLLSEDHKPRKPDGTLRCYQCNSTSDPHEPNPAFSVCNLGNWRHANMSEKREMIMQCPRILSSFCHLAVGLKDPRKTIRGCSPATFSDGKPAALGCFNMGTEYRVCLCDEDLCNRAGRPVLSLLAILYLIWFSLCRPV